ncbi:hypothetical protein V8G54_035345 [Vigna mungo]|uniref:Uncharacterized protein n=1 Tax=Vigna mungo TaxID=3915 RepID=A0AAQ3RD23_VIGMU
MRESLLHSDSRQPTVVQHAFALCKEDKDGGRTKRLLARCMEAHCFCVSSLCNLQVGVHGCYLQTRVFAISVAIMDVYSLLKLGISIRFLLDGGVARRMVCVDGGDDDMVA